MKKHLKIILGALILYLVLLLLLLAAESGAPDATIRSFGDAVWFSIITMTTVGYGDLSPITGLGRVLGFFFAISSIGILSALISLSVHLIAGQFLPRLRLRGGRKKNWYVFSDETEDAVLLAEELRESDPAGLLIFPEGETKRMSGPNVVHSGEDLDGLVRLREGGLGITAFFLGEDEWQNYAAGCRAAEVGIPSYCMSGAAADDVPAALHLFSRNECLSRCYWKEHPLSNDENCVVLIGCGESGSALLERALLTNVYEQGRAVEYHVFGDSAAFRALHPVITEALSGADGEADRLFFESGDWACARDLLGKADRIVICTDDDKDNFECYEKLSTWFPIQGKVHVRLSAALPSVLSFGGREEIITREFVMKDAVNRSAVLLNEIYNAFSPSPTAWEDLTNFFRQSNIAAADHLIVKIRYLLGDGTITELTAEHCRRAYEAYRARADREADRFQEMEHRRWLRFYQMYNWRYDPVRSNALRLHPMMRPYGELSVEERKKDSFAWELLGQLAEQL